MFAPSPGRSQFIELASVTNGPVALFDTLRPTNVWKIDGVGNFAFPQGTVITQGSSIIVCATNPADFRAQYGLSNSVPVFGPWTGALDKDGETLKLLRPGNPELEGTVPYYRVDHVTYGTNAPWPQCSMGVSLRKVPLAAYGNDPVYWQTNQLNGDPGVTSSNRPSIWSPQPDVQFPVNVPWTIPLSAYDPDFPWQTLSFQASGLPAGFALATTPLRVTGSGVSTGDYQVTVTVADDQSPPLSANLQFTMHLIDPLSLSAQLQPGAVQLSFKTIIGETYQVWFCTDLSVGNWQLLQEFANVSNNSIMLSDPQVASAPEKFYRLIWVR
jgi:hypothetical protein